MHRLRLVVPTESTDALLDLLRGEAVATHVVVLRGAAVDPQGDLVELDVPREAASDLLARLTELCPGVSASADRVDVATSREALRARAAAPGHGVDAVVWEEVEERAHEDAGLSASYVALLVVATLIAAIGLMLDSEVLIVGAMVVGPDFGPVAGLTVALRQRNRRLGRKALTALGVGFPIAILAALLLGLATRLLVGLPQPYATGERPLTAFISQPDGWALVVALLAGVAGVVSLTSAKASALVGVAVSVTTVPAAANVGVAAAAGRWDECAGAAGQLLVNVVALVAAGLATLAVRRAPRRRTS